MPRGMCRRSVLASCLVGRSSLLLGCLGLCRGLNDLHLGRRGLLLCFGLLFLRLHCYLGGLLSACQGCLLQSLPPVFRFDSHSLLGLLGLLLGLLGLLGCLLQSLLGCLLGLLGLLLGLLLSLLGCLLGLLGCLLGLLGCLLGLLGCLL